MSSVELDAPADASVGRDLKINLANMRVALRAISERARAGKGYTLFTVNLDHLVKIQRDRRFGEAYHRADFVTATRVWSALHRATGRLNFRQKPTMVSLPLIVDGGRFIPITRFLRPLEALRQPRAMTRCAC